ncbi:hypothetical protein KEK_13418 [Mycolicibacterium thermoresistibile ATCC 19527]|jgi:uncharacterized protein (DUF1697 family)|uniref:Uncharacterized protein n=2 Tax=Mycolicibacterium thermoresistibile TaxID=1797 RepID=G7CGE1_MYCT3|nr:hypothetical protein KEK_13418 [Mycolicibacterium thermoresistibile ATCC 19527]GAT16113.1 pyridoxamine 5'-phosphate oxidase family protein [Mycolicibacterium thermoresistibile]SNW19605.1 pyridoxamine 5'-phosphate oxidase family protein [Mycolicibacterium thermoresistibile]
MVFVARYVAFLRGVNVGGVNLKMASGDDSVAAVFTAAGFSAVRTVLATGNVILDSAARPDTVRATAERALRDRFGYDAWVLVYPFDDVAAISAAFPFERVIPDHHSYVTFVSDPQVLDELAALDPGPGEQIAPGDRVVYWQVRRTQTLTSAMGKTMGKKRYKSSTTTRNLRTLERIVG